MRIEGRLAKLERQSMPSGKGFDFEKWTDQELEQFIADCKRAGHKPRIDASKLTDSELESIIRSREDFRI